MPNLRITQNNRGIDEIIGANCKSLRLEAGCSQEHLAGALGVTYQQIQKYETGRNRIAASTLYCMAGILEVPVSAFFEGLPLQPQPSRISRCRADMCAAYEGLPTALRLHVRAVVQHLSKAARGTP